MKNNKLTNILLIVLMILSIGLITYIFIDKDDKTNDDKNNEIKEQENNTVTNSVSKALNIYESFHNLLWFYWANMMYEQRNDHIYKEIALNKYNNLVKYCKI